MDPAKVLEIVNYVVYSQRNYEGLIAIDVGKDDFMVICYIHNRTTLKIVITEIYKIIMAVSTISLAVIEIIVVKMDLVGVEKGTEMVIEIRLVYKNYR